MRRRTLTSPNPGQRDSCSDEACASFLKDYHEGDEQTIYTDYQPDVRYRPDLEYHYTCTHPEIRAQRDDIRLVYPLDASQRVLQLTRIILLDPFFQHVWRFVFKGFVGHDIVGRFLHTTKRKSRKQPETSVSIGR
jgi:hypothetical protein